MIPLPERRGPRDLAAPAASALAAWLARGLPRDEAVDLVAEAVIRRWRRDREEARERAGGAP